MKHKFGIAGLLCAALLLSACGENDLTNTTTAEYTTGTVQSQQPSAQPSIQTYELGMGSPVKVTGRSAALKAGIALDHSASSLEFTLVGGGDVWLEGKASKDIYFTVFIDGVRQEKRVKYTVGTAEKKLVSDLSDGTHTIRVVRQTEEKYGTFDALSIKLNKSVLEEKPKDSSLYIEFVGDSITCGNGTLHLF